MSDEEVDVIKEWRNGLKESAGTLKLLDVALSGVSLSKQEKEVIAYNIFEGKRVAEILAAEVNAENGVANANKKIMSFMGFTSNVLIDNIRRCIMDIVFKNNEQGELTQRYRSFEASRGQIL